jgi:hypothetical protein
MLSVIFISQIFFLGSATDLKNKVHMLLHLLETIANNSFTEIGFGI